MTEKNAFTSVRPRGVDRAIPASVGLQKNNRGAEPPKIGKAAMVALDRTGRRTVDLAPRDSRVHINTPSESLAMQDKQRKIAGKVGGAGR